jgi:hypothetical protein
MKNYVERVLGVVALCILFCVQKAHGGQSFPGQNLWGLTQQIAAEVDDISDVISINDALLNSKMDILVSFTAGSCDLTSVNEELVEISGQVSVVDSKLDQLSNSIFPVLSTLATASSITPLATAAALSSASAASVLATSVVGSKVDKLSTSIFPVLSTLATAVALSSASAASVLATSVVGSKVDQLSTSVFPILANITSQVSTEPIPVTAAGTISTSGSYRLANNIVGTIDISADGVTFDLNGYTITPVGVTNGINVTTSHKNINIKNGLITGASRCVTIASPSQNIIVEDLQLSDASSVGVSILATDTFSSTVQNFTIRNCTATNVALGGFVFVNCINGTIDSCTVEGACSLAPFNLDTCVGMLINNCIAQKSTSLNGCFYLISAINSQVMSCKAIDSAVGFTNAIGTNNLFVNNCALRNGTNYQAGVTNAAITNFGDVTMNYWKNYSA